MKKCLEFRVEVLGFVLEVYGLRYLGVQIRRSEFRVWVQGSGSVMADFGQNWCFFKIFCPIFLNLEDLNPKTPKLTPKPHIPDTLTFEP